MIPGLPFGAFRWTILTLAVLSQLYLFYSRPESNPLVPPLRALQVPGR